MERETDITARPHDDTAGHLRVSRRSLLLGSLALTAGFASACADADRIPPTPPATTPKRKSVFPSKIIGLYVRDPTKTHIDEVSQKFNVIYLFAATRGKSKGTLAWAYPHIDKDIAACRKRRQRIVLTVGGARDPLTFTSRSVSERLVDSVVKINHTLGGTASHPVLDGVDFNTFEGDNPPILKEYQWMSRELRHRFGPAFGITCPPAPWKLRDQEFCRKMLASDSMDYVGPQFYDGEGLSKPGYIISQVNRWVTDIAAGKANKVVVGFGIGDGKNYSTIQQVSMAVQSIKAAHPDIRGVFLWEHLKQPRPHLEFAREVAPYI